MGIHVVGCDAQVTQSWRRACTAVMLLLSCTLSVLLLTPGSSHSSYSAIPTYSQKQSYEDSSSSQADFSGSDPFHSGGFSYSLRFAPPDDSNYRLLYQQQLNRNQGRNTQYSQDGKFQRSFVQSEGIPQNADPTHRLRVADTGQASDQPREFNPFQTGAHAYSYSVGGPQQLSPQITYHNQPPATYAGQQYDVGNTQYTNQHQPAAAYFQPAAQPNTLNAARSFNVPSGKYNGFANAGKVNTNYYGNYQDITRQEPIIVHPNVNKNQENSVSSQKYVKADTGSLPNQSVTPTCCGSQPQRQLEPVAPPAGEITNLLNETNIPTNNTDVEVEHILSATPMRS